MAGAILRGSLGFAAVSVAAFSVWAFGEPWFKPWGGDGAMFPAIAVVFLGLTGILLHPLAGGLGRFTRVFVPAFFAYAAVWCAAWWLIRKRPGEWVGSIAGSAAFAIVAGALLGNLRPWLRSTLVLAALHSAGYFLGGMLFYAMKTKLGMLGWGLVYGLGFGAGIGYVFGVNPASGIRKGGPPTASAS